MGIFTESDSEEDEIIDLMIMDDMHNHGSSEKNSGGGCLTSLLIMVGVPIVIAIGAISLVACSNAEDKTETVSSDVVVVQEDKTDSAEEVEESVDMTLKIDGKEVPVTWEDNNSVEELKALAENGIEISMSMYGGFEQVGSIGQSIARNDKQTVTSAGDIVLYSGNQIVVFYGSNSWAYTRLGKINLSETELTELLGNEDVTLRIEE